MSSRKRRREAIPVYCRQTGARIYVPRPANKEYAAFRSSVAECFNLVDEKSNKFVLTIGNQTNPMDQRRFQDIPRQAEITLSVRKGGWREAAEEESSSRQLVIEFQDGSENVILPAANEDSSSLPALCGTGSGGSIEVDTGMCVYGWWDDVRETPKTATLVASVTEEHHAGWLDFVIKPLVVAKAIFSFRMVHRQKARHNDGADGGEGDAFITPRKKKRGKGEVGAGSNRSARPFVWHAIPSIRTIAGGTARSLVLECHCARSFEKVAQDMFLRPFRKGMLRVIFDLDRTLVHTTVAKNQEDLRRLKKDKSSSSYYVVPVTPSTTTRSLSSRGHRSSSSSSGGSGGGGGGGRSSNGTLKQNYVVRKRPGLLAALIKLASIAEITIVSARERAYVEAICEKMVGEMKGRTLKRVVSIYDTVRLESQDGTKDIRRVCPFFNPPWTGENKEGRAEEDHLTLSKGLVIVDDLEHVWIGANVTRCLFKIDAFTGDMRDTELQILVRKIVHYHGQFFSSLSTQPTEGGKDHDDETSSSSRDNSTNVKYNVTAQSIASREVGHFKTACE